jgi:hypothetical protein
VSCVIEMRVFSVACGPTSGNVPDRLTVATTGASASTGALSGYER